MNIIETIRNILQSFPKISEVVGEIHVDFADPEPTSYGLSSVGDMQLSEDILGNQRRQHTFLLYTTYSGINDYERLCNSNALLELSYWLHKQTGHKITSTIDGTEHTGELLELKAENGMLYSVPEENLTDGVQYQLQIVAVYTIES